VLCGAVGSELSPPDSDTGIFPKPDNSSPHRHILFLKVHFNIILLHQDLSGLCLLEFLTYIGPAMFCDECKYRNSSSCSVLHPLFFVRCSSPSYSLFSVLHPFFV